LTLKLKATLNRCPGEARDLFGSDTVTISSVRDAPQVPAPGELNVDHVGHFVPDIDAASAALERLGFTLTPFSVQSHQLTADGPLVPAGTGNRCVMFERGYLEILTAIGDTPAADQLRAAMHRFTGVHLIAFGTSAPEADHRRLVSERFAPVEPVALQRPITTPAGTATVRFTVVRVPPGTMAEGRIQFCRQDTPELVWQARWTAHPNGATALTSVLISAEDAHATAMRYARFAGITPEERGEAWILHTARGSVVIAPPLTLGRVLGTAAPAPDSIAGYVLEATDLAAVREFAANAPAVTDLDPSRVAVTLPQAIGGVAVFEAPGTASLFSR
jgi:hypothetical protein